MSEEHAIKPRLTSRGGRLSRSAEFERVYRHGRSTATRDFVLYTFHSPTCRPQPPRPVGLAQGRRRGASATASSVCCERPSRRSRRGRRRSRPGRRGSPGSAELAERDGLPEACRALAELLAKAGLHGAADGEEGS